MNLFAPSSAEVRRFFCQAWRKSIEGQPTEPIEAVAIEIIARHPEYHGLLQAEQAAVEANFDAANGQSNPFLHLALHLAIAEQLAIDQPPGIAAAYRDLINRAQTQHDPQHAAQHRILECLGETLWRAQREGQAPDGEAYLRCMRAPVGRFF